MKSRSTLFLIEQLVVIAVFAICAAVCVKIISVAYAMTTDAVDTRHALIAAENAAESFKAFGGDTERVYFDCGWQPVASGDSPSFKLRVDIRDEGAVFLADITVNRLIDGAELVSLEAAVRPTSQRGVR